MEKSKLKMFEKIISDKMRDFEADNTPNDWGSFEQKLDAALKKAKLINRLKVYSFAAAVVISTVLLYNMFDKQTNRQQLENTMPEIENIIYNAVSETQKETPKITDAKTQTAEISTKPTIAKQIQEKPLKTALKSPVDDFPAKSNEVKLEEAVKIIENSQNTQNKGIEAILYNLFIETGKQSACVGEEIHFSPSIINGNYTYNWNFGNDIKSKEVFPKLAFEQAGIYDIKLTLNAGTNKEQTAYHTITIHAIPDVLFEYEITKETFGYPRIKFIDKSADALQWMWSFGDGRYSYEQHPNHVYFTTENIIYNVSLSVENIHGCKSKYVAQVELDDMFDLMAPNAFSPDGDGLNDYFIPRALEIMDIPFEMFIYDRAGTMVYNTKNKSKPWDGRIGTTGIIPESGTFIWIVLLYDNNGKSYKYAGTVSIVK